MTLRRALARCLIVAAILFAAFASPTARAEAMGIALEGFPYPYPVHFMPLTLQGEDLRLAYMDVAPVGRSNGRTVVLLHGRNFPSSYWEPAIKALTEAGYRVIAPDQIGFGKSSKPTFAYSFDAMARATIALLAAFTPIASVWLAIPWAGCWRSGWRARMGRASTISSFIRRSGLRTIVFTSRR
jgi:alpha/beta hydrolase fold